MNEKRKVISKRSTNSLFHEYNFEIKVTSLMALGIFLLVENMEIKHFIYEIIKNVAFSFGDLVKLIGSIFLVLIKKIEISDLVGLVLIGLAGFLITLRTRIRLLTKYQKIQECPECKPGYKLKRIQKKLKHRIINIILRLRVYNYQCQKCHKKQLVILTKR